MVRRGGGGRGVVARQGEAHTPDFPDLPRSGKSG
jgi:hypothetical protein